MSILDDWKLRDIEKKADDALRRCDEMYSLRSDVDRLERANGELSSKIDELRSQLERVCEAARNFGQAVY
jgi:polyhydroxyalkanoate synthesis regulator phasin